MVKTNVNAKVNNGKREVAPSTSGGLLAGTTES